MIALPSNPTICDLSTTSVQLISEWFTMANGELHAWSIVMCKLKLCTNRCCFLQHTCELVSKCASSGFLVGVSSAPAGFMHSFASECGKRIQPLILHLCWKFILAMSASVVPDSYLSERMVIAFVLGMFSSSPAGLWCCEHRGILLCLRHQLHVCQSNLHHQHIPELERQC